MFKVVYLLKRREEMTTEEFNAHWRDVHAPLVSQVPGIITYKIEPVTGGPDGVRPPFDGVGEVYYQDEAAYRAACDSQEMATAVAAWPRFLSSVTTAFVEEKVVLDHRKEP